jgi:hypothetical protein
MTMQAVAWEYVDSNRVEWRIHGQTSGNKDVYCIRGNEFAGSFDAGVGTLEERGISRWPEVVRAKWREVVTKAQQNAARKAVR